MVPGTYGQVLAAEALTNVILHCMCYVVNC